MNKPTINALLIEDDPAAAKRVQAAVVGCQENRAIRLDWVARLCDAHERLMRDDIEVILLDLSLPGVQGIEAFEQVFLVAPHVPILILGGPHDETAALLAVQAGAHDVLDMTDFSHHGLLRALRNAVRYKDAVDAARISEARVRAMSDTSPVGLFITNVNGGCVYTNTAYQRMSGLSFIKSLGARWSLAIHPEDRERVLDAWCDAVRGRHPYQAEFRYLHDNEQVIWTRAHATTMRDGKKLIGFVKTVEDITECKATEIKLLAAEAKLFEERERAQLRLNSIGDAVLTTDILGHVTYLNQSAEKMTGWFREEANGRPLDEVLQVINSETRQLARNPALLAMEKNQAMRPDTDCVLIRRDGFESGIKDSVAPIHDRAGQVIGAVMVFHDVTESDSRAESVSLWG